MGTLSDMLARQKAAAASESQVKKETTNVSITSQPAAAPVVGGPGVDDSRGASRPDVGGNAGVAAPAGNVSVEGSRPAGDTPIRPNPLRLGKLGIAGVPRPAAVVDHESGDATSPPVMDNAGGQDADVNASPTPSVEGQPDSEPPLAAPAKPAGLKLGGLKLGNTGGSAPSAADAGRPAPEGGAGSSGGGLARLANLTKRTGGDSSGLGSGSGSVALTNDSGVFSLADIGDTEAVGTGVRPEFVFSDQVPAQAPTRELPDDLTEQQAQFVTMLNGIYEFFYDPEMFGGMIRQIMQELQEHPEYSKMVVDEDVHTLMRGLRESMGMAKIKKAEKSKGGGRTGKALTQKAVAATSALDELGFDASDF